MQRISADQAVFNNLCLDSHLQLNYVFDKCARFVLKPGLTMFTEWPAEHVPGPPPLASGVRHDA